jgi:hypothetical protein
MAYQVLAPETENPRSQGICTKSVINSLKGLRHEPAIAKAWLRLIFNGPVQFHC